MIVTTRSRILAKSIMWRMIAIIVTFCTISLVLPFFQAFATAAAVTAIVDGIIKFIVYYYYEKVWTGIKFGKKIDDVDGCCIWLTGLSGAGKTTIALGLVDRLEKQLKRIEYLDGDIVRKTISHDLGFTKADRDENIKRIALVSSFLSRKAITICAFISPYRAARDQARKVCNNFIEVFVDCPLEICEDRDVKGLYAKARAGEIKGFTGIDDPYETPQQPDLHLKTGAETIDESVDRIINYLKEQGHI